MSKREILLNILHDEQERHGYLSEEALKKISVEQNVPISRLWGIATFYTMLHTKPQGKHIIEICGSPSCTLNGGEPLANYLQKLLKIKIGQTTKDKKFSLYKTSCIGCCDMAPAMLIDKKPYVCLTPQKISKIISQLRK